MDEIDDLSELHNRKQAALERKEQAEQEIRDVDIRLDALSRASTDEKNRDSSGDQGGGGFGIF